MRLEDLTQGELHLINAMIYRQLNAFEKKRAIKLAKKLKMHKLSGDEVHRYMKQNIIPNWYEREGQKKYHP